MLLVRLEWPEDLKWLDPDAEIGPSDLSKIHFSDQFKAEARRVVADCLTYQLPRGNWTWDKVMSCELPENGEAGDIRLSDRYRCFSLQSVVVACSQEGPAAEIQSWQYLCYAFFYLGLSLDIEDPIPRYIKSAQRAAGKKKLGKEGALKKTLRLIGSYEQLMHYRDDVDQFNEEDHPNAPCLLQEITDDYLSYRIKASGKEEQRTLDRIRRIFDYELTE